MWAEGSGLFTIETLRAAILWQRMPQWRETDSVLNLRENDAEWDYSAASMSPLLWGRKDDSEHKLKSPEEGTKSHRNVYHFSMGGGDKESAPREG